MRNAILFVGLFVAMVSAGAGETAPDKTPPSKPKKPVVQKREFIARLTDADMAAFSKRFEKELWPLLTRTKGDCTHCHDGDTKSQLEIPDDNADTAFKHLLTEDRFDLKSPSGLMARLISKDVKLVMPPPTSKAPWTDAEISLLKNFTTDMQPKIRADATKMDEMFPIELLSKYAQKPSSDQGGNTFLTYYQLKKKVKTIFNDDWKRDEKDLFNENIALFGGADFVRSYNESSKASATFLTAVDVMGQDIGSRAYVQATGPFASRAKSLPSATGMTAPSDAYKTEITNLYRRLLHRDPMNDEIDSAFKFIQTVGKSENQIALQPQTLRFSLTVSDADGQSTRREFSIPVINDNCGLYQEFVNQNISEKTKAKKKLGAVFTFKANDDAGMFMLSNSATAGNVSLAGIEITGPLVNGTGGETKTIGMKDPSVKLFGAWKFVDRTPPAYEDGNDNKGSSSISIPIRVEKSGQYEIIVLFKQNDVGGEKTSKGKPIPTSTNAENVLVEVLSYDPTRHAIEATKPVPPKGEAHFKIDETVSNIKFYDLKTIFQFGAADGVEINNIGTKKPVVADACIFALEPKEGTKIEEKFTIKGNEAEGHEQWKDYDPGRFKPYNSVGPKLFFDNGEKKSDLKMVYKPSMKKDSWKPAEYYRVRLVVPGKAGNETQAPVIVRAQKSSPIIQLNPPLRLHVGGEAVLDAANTYNLQRSKLTFSWVQTAGPRVEIADPSAPRVTFKVPALGAQQAAWEGLCRALLQHPDFLFTRPPSLEKINDKAARAKLQLVKIAQDLVGRTPNHDELAKLKEGQSLEKFVDDYLKSTEFKDFYFHRIRLTLESHGGDSEDEPARLWTYICLNDVSFKEILSADYSVDAQFKKTDRPAYHGKTGVLTMKGFIDGKPGLPHFNYAAVVCEKFLGYIFEVPANIVAQREGATAASTTHPASACYSCHKILTPLALQRNRWDDKGKYLTKEDKGKPIDDSDQGLVPSYPFKGNGMEAFATQAQHKERFIRTMIQTHFIFFFGREMRYEDDERGLYKKLWDNAAASNYSIKQMLKTMILSPEYLDAHPGDAKLADAKKVGAAGN
ncbi:MAG: hypothetical protein WCT04_11010 [Planctomycetota bacterium]